MERTGFFDKRLTYLFSCDVAFLEVKASPQRQFQHLSFFENDHAADKSSAVYNVFDSDDNDITYFYESQLANETAPVEDIHFHPVEPRTVRVTLSGSF